MNKETFENVSDMLARNDEIVLSKKGAIDFLLEYSKQIIDQEFTDNDFKAVCIAENFSDIDTIEKSKATKFRLITCEMAANNLFAEEVWD